MLSCLTCSNLFITTPQRSQFVIASYFRQHENYSSLSSPLRNKAYTRSSEHAFVLSCLTCSNLFITTPQRSQFVIASYFRQHENYSSLSSPLRNFPKAKTTQPFRFPDSKKLNPARTTATSLLAFPSAEKSLSIENTISTSFWV